MEDISRYIVLPYESKDYGPFLQVMHAMWPEFTFTDQDLARKDMIYAGELSRWGVWEGNELLSCCNLYMRPEEFFVSWFYRPDSSGGISAIRVLISHILEKAYVDEAEITSRVLGSHPLWPILQSFGFFPRKSIVDWVLDIEQRGGITDITVSEPESSYFSLDQCRNDMRILRQIYELELDYVGKVPPWFTFQVFYRNLLSIPTLNTSASTVLLQG
ncbi:hypothetical protein [Calidithermus roseus]|uniref:hypothetical protein n=1 Tax=Calidithermus roseus TaxID=1644118 RepID=UPI000E64A4D7|nr:hypothetical protein [Calidithermus roseus]